MDYLVKLYDLPFSRLATLKSAFEAQGISIRRGLTPEKHLILSWVRKHFNAAWASECDAAFARQPVSCFIAVQEKAIIGFTCYEATAPNFVGPTGVIKTKWGAGFGLGYVLALQGFKAMAEIGYAYAIAGAAIPNYYPFYFGAIPIEDSSPGHYRGMLHS